MNKSNKFSPEVRERSVRMVVEHQGEHESQWAAIVSLASKVGCTAEASCPVDHVQRQFSADRPNALWVSDFTYVSTWQGFVYVAFVIDVFARRIVGWRASVGATRAVPCCRPSSRRRRIRRRRQSSLHVVGLQ